MRIGIHPALKRHDGGIYQYTVTFLNALHELSASGGFAEAHEFVVFAHDSDDPVLERIRANPKSPHPNLLPREREVFSDSGWRIESFRPPWALQATIDFNEPTEIDRPRQQADMRAWFQECGIDLMIYPSPHRLSFEAGIPFLMAVHDLQHRLQPEFPEVSAGGEWERREYVLSNAASKATLLIAESQVGREDILAAYGPQGVTTDRVKVLPYLPNPTIGLEVARKFSADLRERHRLPERYLFYPAQFWPHKNHVRLVESLGLLRDKHGLNVPLVLTGSSTGQIRQKVLAEVESRCAALRLEEQVRVLGYVTDEEVAALYAGAEALVMPTFFGPTNLPFLEAWSLECPVLTSRIRGIVEQVGDAALTVDPTRVEELADGIYQLWTDESLRRTLLTRGVQRLSGYTPLDFRRRLAEIIAQAVERVGQNRKSRGVHVKSELV